MRAGAAGSRRGRLSLNESPSEKEGKSEAAPQIIPNASSLNESPSEKEGKCWNAPGGEASMTPSMKVPPKRKGNSNHGWL